MIAAALCVFTGIEHIRQLRPLELDLGAGLRLRAELQDNFNVEKFDDGYRDEILFERLRVELGLHFLDGFRLFAQGQDAHEVG